MPEDPHAAGRCRVRVDAGRLILSLDGQDRLVLAVGVDGGDGAGPGGQLAVSVIDAF